MNEESWVRRLLTPRVFRIGVGLLLLAIVAVCVRIALREDGDRRRELLAHTRSLAMALPRSDLELISGRVEDASLPAYARIKSRLARLAAESPNARFVYLVCRDPSGQVVFVADSEPAGSPDESPAGKPYPDAPPALVQVLSDGLGRTVGPYTDSYGRWVSAFVPLVSRPGFVLGLDVDAGEWRMRILLGFLPLAGLLVLLGVGLALMGVWVWRRRLGANVLHNPWAVRLVLTVGPTLSVGVLFIMALHQWGQQIRAQDTYNKQHVSLFKLETIVRLDEAMANAALLAAYGRDPGQAKRHERFAEELDELLAVRRSIDGGVVSSLMEEIEALSRSSVELERRAFDRVVKGDPDGALALLTSDIYREKKRGLVRSVQVLRENLLAEERRLVKELQNQAWRQIQFLGAASLVVGASWLLIFRFLRERDRAEKCRAEEQEAHRRELEETVRERTVALAERERSFRLLFETMTQGVVVQDAEGVIVEANPAAERILGLSREQLLGRASRDPEWGVTDAEGRPLSGEEHPSQIAQRTGQPVIGAVVTVRVPGGDSRWLEVNSVPIFTEQAPAGPPIQTHTTFTDITQRVNMEKSLAERTKELESFFTISLGLLAILDLGGRFLRLNGAWSDILGLAPEDMMGKKLRDFVMVEDETLLTEAFERLGKGLPLHHLVLRLRIKDGALRSVEWRAAVLGDRIYAAARDVTHQIEMDRLRERERQVLETVVESDISGHWDWDLPSGGFRLSPAGLRMLGYHQGDLRQHIEAFRELLHPEDRMAFHQALRRHFSSQGSEPFYCELRWRAASGRYLWFICYGAIVEWESGGSAVRMVGALINITRARESEAELAAAYARLEKASAEAQRLSLVATRTTNAVIFTDPQRRIIWVNEGFTRVTGYTYEEAIGKKPGDFLQCPETSQETIQAIREALNARVHYRGEILNRSKSGTLYWINLDITPLYDATGEHTGFLALELDITERKQAELALAEAAERTEMALAGGGLGLWDWEVQTGRARFDRRWAEMMGERPEDIGESVEEWVKRCHPDDYPRVRRELDRHFAGETVRYESTHRMRHRDGSWRWIYDTGKVFRRDAQGRPLRMVGTHRDVTAEHEAQAELARRAAALDHIGNLAKVGYWDFDLINGDLFWSDHTRRIHEVEPDYVPKYTSAVSFYPEDSAEVIRQAVEAAVREAKPFEHVLPFVTAKGNLRFVRTLGEPVLHEGMVIALRGAIQDVTEQQRQKAALAEARDAAEAATRAKSEFLANMSHEIRTPMNGVLGLIELLADTPLNEQQRRYVSGIQTSGQVLLNLINDILDLSKIEAGKLQLADEPFDLEKVLRDFCAPYELQARSKSLAFKLTFREDVPRRVRGDPHRLMQIVQNLVGNALKFTEQGEIAVTVEPSPGEPDLVRFVVRDTGPGIPPEKQELLFRKFSQVDSSRTRSHGGTGLGLAIVRELSAMMGGAVGVASRPGRGSTFWFTAHLPRAATEVVAAPLAAEEAAPRAGFEGVRVLLVEDNLVNQQVARGLLEKIGVEVVIASNGREAIEQVRVQDFALILMDIQMPVMDGVEAMQRIRDSGTGARQPRVPILAMTAHALSGDREKCLAEGFDDYLTKPVSGEALRAALRRWVGARSSVVVQAESDKEASPAAAPAEAGAAAVPAPVPSVPVTSPTAVVTTADSGASIVPPPSSPGLWTLGPEVLDFSDLRQRMMGDERLARRILAAFREDLDSNLEQLRGALAARDWPLLARLAHSLKGASANISAPALRAAAADLERAAKVGDLAECEGLLHKVEVAAEALRPGLSALVLT